MLGEGIIPFVANYDVIDDTYTQYLTGMLQSFRDINIIR
jgi:hypothetical protein